MNALCQRRLSLIRRTYFIWKENSTFQKHKRSWLKSNPGKPLPSPVSPKSNKLAELLKKKRKRTSESEDAKSQTSLSSSTSGIGSSLAARPQKKRPKLALTPGVLGLRNLGNTCYLNSILQVLGHILPFTEFFLRLNISGFSSPPGSPVRSRLEEYEKQPENIFEKLTCEIDTDVSTSAVEEEMPSCNLFSTPPSPETLKPRTKRLSTSECYQRISRKTCNGLEGGSTSSAVSSSVCKQATNATTSADASETSEANSEIDDENNDVMLAEELHALLRVMWAGKHHLVAPFGLLHSVWKTIPFLRGHAQQDAQEFLQVFLDRIERELEDYVPNRKLQYEQIFYGEIQSQVNCLKCNSENRVREPFSDLPLEFPERFQSDRCSKMDSCDIYEMLSQFTNTESLGRVYSCEFCKSNQRLRRKQVLTDAEKRLAFTRLPLVLIVHFKRFRWFGRTGREKINAHVSFPFLLDLSDYVSEDIKNTSGALYNLQAVVRHHGSGFTSGHYTAYCWNHTSHFWMHFNDAKAERCTEDDVKATQAYILFYVKCDGDSKAVENEIIHIVQNAN